LTGSELGIYQPGTGLPLVLLHGAGDNARDWSYVLSLLGRSHQVFAPDLPGYSPASAPATDYSPARLARFILSFMDAVGLDSAAVAGNSLGGLAALQLALFEPERVSALCLWTAPGWAERSTRYWSCSASPDSGSWRSPSGGVAPEQPCERWRGRCCCSGVHGGRPAPGWSNSTGPPANPDSWRRRWPVCARSSDPSVSARCWPSGLLS
jgi:pimeloyl-ACP methyl ester carboxylesterase